MRNKAIVFTGAAALVIVTVPVALSLGSEFLPPMDEGAILYMPTSVPGMSVAQAQSVFFNNSRVTVFNPNSTDSKLIIDRIPDVPGVQASGTQVTLTVANFATSDSRQVTLQAAQSQQREEKAITPAQS